MKVLYIDGAGPFGGAARSLYELVRPIALSGKVDAYFVMQRGTASRFYRQVASGVITVPGLTRLDNSRFSYYRGLRWLILLREVYHFPFSVFAVVSARVRWGRMDLIHANEVFDIVPALIARVLFRAPLVVHVRSLQREVEHSRRARWLTECLLRVGATPVAIDQSVAATLASDLPVQVVHNSFTPAGDGCDSALRERLAKLRPGSLKVGFVGNLHVSKGIFELVEAVRMLIGQGLDVECVVAGGETRRDVGLVGMALKSAGFLQNVGQDVVQLVQSCSLQHCFHLLGPVDDITSVYKALDVVAFPSHFDAPGRPVLEAALLGVPAVVCVSTPRSDTLIHGDTGLAIPSHDPAALAEALASFYHDRTQAKRMGSRAKALALENCDPAKNANDVMRIYECAVSEALTSGR